MSVMVLRTTLAVLAILAASFSMVKGTIQDLERARQPVQILTLVSPEESIRRTKEGAESGDLIAQLILAHASYNGTKYFSQDFAAAVYWYMKAAKQGSPYAQRNLAVMYARGEGVEKDEARALVWYRTAAAGGDIPAQVSLAIMLEQGRGAAQDKTEAHIWRQRVALQTAAP